MTTGPRNQLPDDSRAIRDLELEELQEKARKAVVMLWGLKATTEPDLEEQSEKEKDLAATKALAVLSELNRTLAGWAIDHQVGLGIGRRPSWLAASREFINLESFEKLTTENNLHTHEISGANCQHGDGEAALDGEQLRQILENILSSRALGLSGLVLDQMLVALRAARRGEAHEMFLIKQERSHKPHVHSKESLQIFGLQAVRYMSKRGTRTLKAQEAIAEAYSVETDTVKVWKYELEKSRGKIAVNAYLEMGKQAAELQVQFPEVMEVAFGAVAIREAGQAYRALALNRRAK